MNNVFLHMSYYYYSPEPKLFFIEEILKSSEKGEPDIAVALDANDAENSEDSNTFTQILINPNENFVLTEGNYVYYNQSVNQGGFYNGNGDVLAKRNLFRNNVYRSRLAKLQKSDDNGPNLSSNLSVYSYHVNVGHGNCSILVLKSKTETKIWMVDCSNHDFLTGVRHQSSIEQCFNHILKKFKLKEIKIERFFLTHSHYDHYSGVSKLIQDKRITSDTIFYLNVYYSMPSSKYNSLLRNINSLKCSVIQPMTGSSRNGIDFWYPNNILVRSAPKVAPPLPYTIESNVNNSSSVFKLTFGDKSILFTGDVETPGWNSITGCPFHLGNASYHVVSHHGSINGHLRSTCPVFRPISHLGDCKTGNTFSIIMGRDKAYSGMYSSQVISDLSPNLIYSEKDTTGINCDFLEIEWQSNTFNWY